MVKRIVDISEHEIRKNGFHPQKLAAEADGIMLRLGWAGYNGEIGFDDSIGENILSAAEAGLSVGLYLYCYCKSPTAANLAANRAVRFAKEYAGKIDMPIAIMVCETHLPCLISQGREGLTDTVTAFIFETERLGWQGMFATYTAFAQTYLDMNRLKNRELWIADYRLDEKVMQRQLGREDYGMWQLCSGGVGVSRCYKNYPKIIFEQGKNSMGISC